MQKMQSERINQSTDLAILIPVMNEEENIPLMVQAIHDLDLVLPYTIYFVNDGSVDRSWEQIRLLASQDYRVKGFSFSRNFGHQMALSAGINSIDADIIIMMDADFQHDPKHIPAMIEKYAEGYDVVQMVKKDQGDRSLLQKIPSYLFYASFRKISKIELSHNVSDFRLISKNVANEFKKIKEKEVFLRGLVAWAGFNYCEIEYEVGKRVRGQSKYNLLALFRLASFGIFSFSDIPLKISIYLGMLFSLFSFSYGFFAITKRLLSPELMPVGFTDIIAMVTFLGGIQLVSIGVLGVYLGKVFEQVKGRPNYIIRETC